MQACGHTPAHIDSPCFSHEWFSDSLDVPNSHSRARTHIRTHTHLRKCITNDGINQRRGTLFAPHSPDSLKVCSRRMLQCTLAIVSTHFNVRVRASKCYGRSILEHVRTYDATNLLILGSTCVYFHSSHIAIEYENVTTLFHGWQDFLISIIVNFNA